MKILFIRRHPSMGYSIERVSKPISDYFTEKQQAATIILQTHDYSLKSLLRNVKQVVEAIRKERPNIVHIQGTEHYLCYITRFFKGIKTVVTVHDIGFYTNVKHSFRIWLKKYLFIDSLKKADALTFISVYTEQQTKETINSKAIKTYFIPNTAPEEYCYSPKAINTQCPTLLHIGTKKNKNLHTTIKALEGLNCKLRIIGSLDNDDIELLKECRIDYSSAKDLTDEEIHKEYVDCDVVSFISLFEGFGMPIIEGQAIGRPVITSNIEPMKSVAGKGACVVDPNDINSIREGIKSMLNSPDKYIEAGEENIKRYSLNNIAKQYENVYASLTLK